MAAIILAGGKSLRMGCDKSLIKIDGKALIDRITSLLSASFQNIIVCGGRYELSLPNVKYVDDYYRGAGPIGGLYSGLYESSDEINFVTACDIPEMDIKIIDYMRYSIKRHDSCVIKIGEYVEPLFAFYKRSVLPVIKSSIENGNYKISGVYKLIDVKYIPAEEIRRVSPKFEGIYNINTPCDLSKYLKEYHK